MTLVLSLGTMIPMRQPQSEDHQRIVKESSSVGGRLLQ